MARLTAEQQDLVTRHLDFAAWVAGPTIARNPNHADDLVSLARLELCKAAIRFDPAKGFKFTTYADRRIRWVLFDWVKKQARQVQTATVSDDGIDRIDSVPSRDTRQQEIDEINSACPSREAEAAILVCVHGLSTPQASRRMGISQQSVSQKIAKAAARFKARIPQPTT